MYNDYKEDDTSNFFNDDVSSNMGFEIFNSYPFTYNEEPAFTLIPQHTNIISQEEPLGGNEVDVEIPRIDDNLYPPNIISQEEPFGGNEVDIEIPKIDDKLYPPNIVSQEEPHAGDDVDVEIRKRDDKTVYPQWSYQETKDFIEIRAEVEWDDTTGKKTKNLWKVVSDGMSEKGYTRTTEQCKHKWKNIVNRYKGVDPMDFDNVPPPCPFFNELHAVFTARDIRKQQTVHEAEGTSVKGNKKRKVSPEDECYEDFLNENGEEEIDTDQLTEERVAPKGKTGKWKNLPTENNQNSNLASLQETLREFLQQQLALDMQMQETIGRLEQQRNLREQEWRDTMEQLERERIVREEAWREREEQRRLREEIRAEKRDALYDALLNRLGRDENP